jgi:iron only hydrogenase large subunit-like protein
VRIGLAQKYYHPIKILQEKCEGRMRCMRVCPTEALRVRHGKVRLIEELCIDCGECANVCPSKAIVPLTDPFIRSSKFKYRAALASPVLYSQFGLDIDPRIVVQGLRDIGFDYVVDVSSACGEISAAIDIFLEEYQGPGPLISSFCPSVVRLVQVRYPGLTELLMPVNAPREIAARQAKEELSERLNVRMDEIEVLYLTPCPAKIVAIKQPAEKGRSWIDGAISIADIYAPLFNAVSSLADDEIEKPIEQDHTFGAGWSMLGEMTRLLGSERGIAVSGLSDVTRILDDIESGRLRGIDFVEASACLGGCIGGSLTVDNMYVARSAVLSLMRKHGESPVIDKDKVVSNYREGYYFLEHKLAPRPLPPLDKDISRAIQKKKEKHRIYASLPQIDCGCCGSPNCMAFAEDIVRGRSKVEDCIHMRSI